MERSRQKNHKGFEKKKLWLWESSDQLSGKEGVEEKGTWRYPELLSPIGKSVPKGERGRKKCRFHERKRLPQREICYSWATETELAKFPAAGRAEYQTDNNKCHYREEPKKVANS